MIRNFTNHIKKVLSPNEFIISGNFSFPTGMREKDSRIYINIYTTYKSYFIKYDLVNTYNKGFKTEYDALRNIVLNKFNTPKPFLNFKRGIIVSEISGELLSTTLSRNKSILNINLLNKCVEYICDFHTSYSLKIDKGRIGDIYTSLTGLKISAQIWDLLPHANFGSVHGDLDPFNIIFDKNKNQLSLIDWEDFSNYGIQELDILHFVIMSALIYNENMPQILLYDLIFEDTQNNPYNKLLKVYCKKRKITLEHLLQFIPIYCDAQNFRLIKSKRDTSKFLFNKFKMKYYDKK